MWMICRRTTWIAMWPNSVLTIVLLIKKITVMVIVSVK